MHTTHLSWTALSVPGAEPSPRRWRLETGLKPVHRWEVDMDVSMDSGSRKGEFWAEGNLGLTNQSGCGSPLFPLGLP